MKKRIYPLITWLVFTGSLSAQENDNCAEAILLKAGKSCSYGVFSNAGATAEADTVAPDPSCGLYKGADVWFAAVMPESGVIRIETDNLGSTVPHSITVYSGSCGNFTEVLCFRQDNAKTFSAPQLAGEMLYFRVYSLNGATGTPFNFCVWEPALPANDNCESAIEIDASTLCNAVTYSNAYSTSQPASTAPLPSCGFYKGGDVWFKTIIQASGSLRVESHNLSGATSKSVTVYSGSCGAFIEKFCLQLDDNRTFYDPDWAGQTVYIRVFSYDSEEGGEFDLCLFSPTEPENDNCENARDLPINKNCDPQIFSNAMATTEPVSVAGNPSCGQYLGGDVWFKATWPNSGKLGIMTNSIGSATEKSIVLYRGSCGKLTEVACGQLESMYPFDLPELAGETVFIRVFSYASEEGSAFSLCATEINCETIVIDAGNYSICEGESFSFGTKNLTEAGVYQEIFHSVYGCDSIVTLTLDVHSIDASIIQEGMTLIATNDSASFQWVDCANGNMPILNETENKFTSSVEGNFAVIISENNCFVTSDCYEIKITGLNDNQNGEVLIYPNPVEESLQIEINELSENVLLELYSSKGQVLTMEHFYDSRNIHFPMKNLPSGVYILKITTDVKTYLSRILKNQ